MRELRFRLARGRRVATRGAILTVILGITAWSQVALAQNEDDQARAQELFERGVAAARDADFPAAVEAFRRSFDLYPHPGTMLNLGLYLIDAGERVEAHATIRDLLDRYGTVISQQAREEMTQRLETLEAALARVSVESDPSGATLVVDGRERGVTPTAEPLVLEPGEHAFEARLEGREPASTSRDLAAGELVTMVLTFAPVSSGPAPVLVVESGTEGALVTVGGGEPEPAPLRLELEPDAAEPERRSFWRGPWPWVVAGALLLGAVGVTLGVTLPEDEPQPDWTMRVE